MKKMIANKIRKGVVEKLVYAHTQSNGIKWEDVKVKMKILSYKLKC
jgi:hypothetical protein